MVPWIGGQPAIHTVSQDRAGAEAFATKVATTMPHSVMARHMSVKRRSSIGAVS
jgi:hypothetical protein